MFFIGRIVAAEISVGVLVLKNVLADLFSFQPLKLNFKALMI